MKVQSVAAMLCDRLFAKTPGGIYNFRHMNLADAETYGEMGTENKAH